MRNKGIQIIGNPAEGELRDLAVKAVRNSLGQIVTGLQIGNTENQNKALILIANKGEFFYEPTLGVAIDELVLDNDYLRKSHQIVEELDKDNYKVKEVKLQENKPIQILGTYE